MPMFDYRCQKCGYKFEELTFSWSDTEVTCPKCSSTETEKLICAPISISSSTSNVPSECACGIPAGSGFS